MKPIFQVFSFFVFRQSLDDFWPHSRAPVKKIRKFDLKVWLVSLCIIKVIRSNLRKRPPFHNGHFSTTAMATKAWPQLPNNFWITASFFNEWWKSQETIRKLDPYGALMINRTKRILFVFHLYCCSKHKFSTILGANVASLFCIFSYILCDWITSMRNTKHELSTINMFYSPQKIVILPHPTTPPPHLPSVPEVAVVERFNCMLHFLPGQRKLV